jgi:hypothetical protein
MKHFSNLGSLEQEQVLPKIRITLWARERAERLYLMGELAAAAELLVQEAIQ